MIRREALGPLRNFGTMRASTALALSSLVTLAFLGCVGKTQVLNSFEAGAGGQEGEGVGPSPSTGGTKGAGKAGGQNQAGRAGGSTTVVGGPGAVPGTGGSSGTGAVGSGGSANFGATGAVAGTSGVGGGVGGSDVANGGTAGAPLGGAGSGGSAAAETGGVGAGAGFSGSAGSAGDTNGGVGNTGNTGGRGSAGSAGAPADACAADYDPGPCDGSFAVFASIDGSCRPTIYGGCGGNSNRFGTIEECLLLCESRPLGKPCPEGRVAAGNICLACSPAGGCQKLGEFCVEPCQSDRDCTTVGHTCSLGLCQAVGCD